MPQRGTNGDLKFDGSVYTKYVPGTLGWVSELLDPLLQERITLLGMAEKPMLYVSDFTRGALETQGNIMQTRHAANQTAATPPLVAQLLMYVPPQGELEDVKGHTGSFFDIQASFDRQLINIFALLEIGRRLQRSLVFSTDCRFSLQDLPGDTSDRKTDFLKGCRFAAGNPFETVLNEKGDLMARPGAGKQLNSEVGSLVIKRERVPAASEHDACLQAKRKAKRWGLKPIVPLEVEFETFVKPAALQGLIPTALVTSYQFWRTGPRLIRGYPIDSKGETAITIELQCQVFLPRVDSAQCLTLLFEPNTPCSVVVQQYLKDFQTELKSDYFGRALPNESNRTISEAGVAHWTAIIRRVPYYNTSRGDEVMDPESKSEDLIDAESDGAKTEDGAPADVPRKSVHKPMMLLNLSRAPQGTFLYTLSHFLSRLDNLSNILVWSSSEGFEGEDCEITSIELSRLKTSFSVRGGESGRSGAKM
jgi:hypothetical protein